MKHLFDSKDERLNELAQAIDESLASDRPAAWPPAFAASDAKMKPVPIQPITELMEQREGATATASAEEAEALVARSDSFLSLVKGWLGRA